MKKMPPGYQIQVAGAVEEASKGQGAIAAGVPVVLFIIFTLLMLQLHSFSRADAGVPHRPAGHGRRGRRRCWCSTGRSASWRCWA